MKNELCLLVETLNKKKGVLEKILEKSKEQYQLAALETFDAQKFDSYFDEKDVLLKELERLDLGFDTTYQRIRMELLENTNLYKEELNQLQNLIKTTVEIGSQIHTTETRTKDRLSNVMFREKSNLKNKKSSVKSVSNYYKANANLSQVDPYFLDQKF